MIRSDNFVKDNLVNSVDTQTNMGRGGDLSRSLLLSDVDKVCNDITVGGRVSSPSY